MPEYKHYKSDTKTDTYVSFKFLDDKNNVIATHGPHACFSLITYSAIPDTCKKIVFFRDISTIPYNLDIIKKWIAELNELDFPCQVECEKSNEKVINFTIDLKDFQKKIVVNCTLQLIRCLTESYICYVPDIYFNILDQNPKIDKFIALQDAHRKCPMYANTNHMITCNGNGNNITKEIFLERVQNHRIKTYDNNGYGDCNISSLWRG